VLLVVAALLVTSFVRLTHVSTGFAVEHVVLADFALSTKNYEAAATRTQFFDRLLEKARALPGVSAAALASRPPLSGETQVQSASLEQDLRPLTEVPIANFRFVDAAYFNVLRITLRKGRLFDDRDRGRPAAVLNERLAAALWPGQDPLGRRFHRGGNDGPLHEVIGIVADTREINLQKTPYFIGYLPYWNDPPTQATLVLRSSVDPLSLAPPVRKAVETIDRAVPVPSITTLQQVVAAAVAPNRFQMLLVGAFAACALLLASLGVYGVPALAVARRTQEMGIRLALGAAPRALVRSVVREGLMPVVLGLAIGVIGALATGRLIQGLLFDVTATDARAFAIVLALLAVVAVVACYIPARRVTRIDPVQALRCE
jgi:predicted permease